MSKYSQKLILFAVFSVFFYKNVTAREIHVSPSNLKVTWSSINPGDKVIFSDGEYRDEMLLLANKAWSTNQPTIFIAESAGKAIIKGSDIVKGWHKIDSKRYAKDWSIEPAQVFINGVGLTQLGGTIFGGFPNDPTSSYNKLHQENNGGGIWPGRFSFSKDSEMPINSFYYDKDSYKLILNVTVNPNQSKVEVSVRRRPFYAEGVSGIVLDGLVFEHANTSIAGRGAALTIIGNNNIIRNVVVRNVDLAGIQTVGDGNQLLNSIAEYNGQMGVTMRGAKNRVVGVNASFNNTRGFNKWWEAGGFKLVGERGFNEAEFLHNIAVGNNGDGIWFDWKNKHNLIKGNVAAYNTGFGIHYELSQHAIIQDNKVYGNGQRGVFLRDSANCEVSNNLVIGNGLEGIVAVYTGQKDAKGTEFGAENAKVNANIVGWNNGALIMPKGASTIGMADNNVYLGDQKSNRFSLGYPSTFSRAVNTLKDWQTISSFDKKSVEGNFLMPKEIAESLSKRELIKDWSDVIKLVEQVKKNQGSVDFKSF